MGDTNNINPTTGLQGDLKSNKVELDFSDLDGGESKGSEVSLDFSDLDFDINTDKDQAVAGGEYAGTLTKVQERLGNDANLLGDYQKDLADSQGAGEQFSNMLLRVVPNAALSIVGDAASILDVEDYWNQDGEVGNWVTEAMEEYKQDVRDWAPIYRERPGEVFDMADPAWWFENGAGLLESAVSFAALGGGVAKGLQAVKWMNSLRNATKMGAKATEAVKGIGNMLTTSTLLNQAESIRTASEIYKDTLKKGEAMGLSVEENKKKAAEAASYSILVNRANIALNLTSAGRFFKSGSTARSAIKEITKANTFKAGLQEGVQEYVEENINLIAEKEGKAMAKALINNKDHEFSMSKAFDTVASKEGLEVGFWGFLGGKLQTVATEGGVNNIALQKEKVKDSEGNFQYKKTGKKAYIPSDAYKELAGKENVTQEDIDGVVESYKISEDGAARMTEAFINKSTSVESLKENEIETRRVSKNALKKEKLAEQDKYIKEKLGDLKGTGVDMFDTMKSGEEQAASQTKLTVIDNMLDPEIMDDTNKRESLIEGLTEEANKIKDPERKDSFLKSIEEIKTANAAELTELRKKEESKMLAEQVFEAAHTGNLEGLEEIYKEMGNVSEEEAAAKGFSEDYKEKSSEALSLIKKFEKTFDKNHGRFGKVVEKQLFKDKIALDDKAALRDKKIQERDERMSEREAYTGERYAEVEDLTDADVDPEITKLNSEIKQLSEEIKTDFNAYKQNMTTKGAQKLQIKAYEKFIKEFKTAKKERDYANDLKTYADKSSNGEIVINYNGKDGIIAVNEEGDYAFMDDDGNETKITPEIFKKIRQDAMTKESHDAEMARREEEAHLSAVELVIDAFISETEDSINDVAKELALKEAVVTDKRKTVTKMRDQIAKLKSKDSLTEEDIEDLETQEGMLRELDEDVDALVEEVSKLREKEIHLWDVLTLTDEKKTEIQANAMRSSFEQMWYDAMLTLEEQGSYENLTGQLMTLGMKSQLLEDDVALLKEAIAEANSIVQELKNNAAVGEKRVNGMIRKTQELEALLQEYEQSLAEVQDKLETVGKAQGIATDATKMVPILEQMDQMYRDVKKGLSAEIAKVRNKAREQGNLTAEERKTTPYVEISYDGTPLEGDTSDKKLSIYTSAGDHDKAIDTNDLESMRWFAALNNMNVEDGYFVKFVSYNETVDADGKTKAEFEGVFSESQIQYEKDNKVNGIKMILSDAKGNPVKANQAGEVGKGSELLTMTMHNPDNKDTFSKDAEGNWSTRYSIAHALQSYVRDENGSEMSIEDIKKVIVEDGEFPNQKGKSVQDVINNSLSDLSNKMKNFRSNVQEKGSVYSEVQDISGGHAQLDKDAEKDVVGNFVDSISDLDSFEIDAKGNVILKDNANKKIKAKFTTLTDEDVDLVLAMLDFTLNNKDGFTRSIEVTRTKRGKGNKMTTSKEGVDVFFHGKKKKVYPALESFVYWGQAKEGASQEFQIYYDKGAGMLYFGESGSVAFSDMKDSAELKEFLSKKKFNFNKATQRIVADSKGKAFSIPVLQKNGGFKTKSYKPKGNLTGYEVYLIETGRLKTNLKENKEHDPNYRGRYVEFSSETTSTPKTSTRTKSDKKKKEEGPAKKVEGINFDDVVEDVPFEEVPSETGDAELDNIFDNIDELVGQLEGPTETKPEDAPVEEFGTDNDVFFPSDEQIAAMEEQLEGNDTAPTDTTISTEDTAPNAEARVNDSSVFAVTNTGSKAKNRPGNPGELMTNDWDGLSNYSGGDNIISKVDINKAKGEQIAIVKGDSGNYYITSTFGGYYGKAGRQEGFTVAVNVGKNLDNLSLSDSMLKDFHNNVIKNALNKKTNPDSDGNYSIDAFVKEGKSIGKDVKKGWDNIVTTPADTTNDFEAKKAKLREELVAGKLLTQFTIEEQNILNTPSPPVQSSNEIDAAAIAAMTAELNRDIENMGGDEAWKGSKQELDRVNAFIEKNALKLGEKNIPLRAGYFVQQYNNSGRSLKDYLNNLEEYLKC